MKEGDAVAALRRKVNASANQNAFLETAVRQFTPQTSNSDDGARIAFAVDGPSFAVAAPGLRSFGPVASLRRQRTAAAHNR